MRAAGVKASAPRSGGRSEATRLDGGEHTVMLLGPTARVGIIDGLRSCRMPTPGDQRQLFLPVAEAAAGRSRGQPAERVTLPVFLVEDGLVTDAQVRRLREKRMAGKTLAAAAAAVGMSERAARRWQSGALPSTAKGPRWWRTREDPFAEVWQSEVAGFIDLFCPAAPLVRSLPAKSSFPGRGMRAAKRPLPYPFALWRRALLAWARSASSRRVTAAEPFVRARNGCGGEIVETDRPRCIGATKGYAP